MPKSGDRFYLMKFENRDAMWGDIGAFIRIQGIVVGGNGAGNIALMLPSASGKISDVRILSDAEWSDFISFSDNPLVLVDLRGKIFHRKLRYEISGTIQQKVWAADGFKCMYCGHKMGEVQLSIDHFLPLELGGANDTSNYLSACKKDNKDKGGISPQDWCALKGLDYTGLVNYLAERKIT